MKLNSFLWNNFVESESGRAWIEFFSTLRQRYERSDQRLLAFITEWSSHGTLGQTDVKSAIELVMGAARELDQAMNDGLLPTTVDSWQEAEAFFEAVGELVTDDDEDEDLFYADDIPQLSIALFFLFPKFFFPYYFYPNFHELKRISDEFGIFLPPVPPKSDFHRRFHYYLELCHSIHDYWSGLGLAPEQFPAFLYGFSPEVVDFRHPKLRDLPKAHRAWFVGGGINNNGDFEYLDKVESSMETFWQGNKETEEGDIIVMYCLAPRSCIHSIWRAIRPGGVEPFRNFYNTIWMGYPQLVKPITYTEMKGDPVLRELPLVKGNMQGINGRSIPKKYYDRILSLLEKKGVELDTLPRLEDVEVKGLRLENERDVELHLLEPLLKELGFQSSDWERQVKLRVGRNEKAIPDYLIHVTKDVASKSPRADWVWEAKFSIESHDQLQRDFEQACSYARLVDAKGVGVISKEGVWTATKGDHYSLKSARHWSAAQIHEVDHLNELRAVAGKTCLAQTAEAKRSKHLAGV